MSPPGIAVLVLAALGAATSPATASAPFTLNSTAWTPETILQPGELILFGEGKMEVVQEHVYHSLLDHLGIAKNAPTSSHAAFKGPAAGASRIDARDCSRDTAVIVDGTSSFVGWDIQMSPVVLGTGNGISISVASGYTTSNSVSVSGGAEVNLIKEKLGAELGINYGHTWTTSQTINIQGVVPNGEAGCLITKPLKTRRTGRTLQGCLGSQKQTGKFTADDSKEASYNGVHWVSGAITICHKKSQLPLSFCNGGGHFV